MTLQPASQLATSRPRPDVWRPAACDLASAADLDKPIPAAIVDAPKAKAAASETLVLAGGCFWGQQGVFRHVKGVTKVVAGYSGGTKETATYPQVTTEKTGHAEAVEITFDPRVVSAGDLLRIFFQWRMIRHS